MEFLQKKWCQWYAFLDVNKDGKISKEDVEESRSKFTKLHSELTGDQAKLVQVDFANWWKKYIFRNKEGEISQDEFIKTLTDDYNKDKAKFVAEMTECFNVIFDVIDTNRDRSIEEDEFIIAFQAYGHENDSLIKAAYKGLGGSKENPVPLKDIVQAWVDFVSGSDSKVDNAVKTAFDSGV